MCSHGNFIVVGYAIVHPFIRRVAIVAIVEGAHFFLQVETKVLDLLIAHMILAVALEDLGVDVLEVLDEHRVAYIEEQCRWIVRALKTPALYVAFRAHEAEEAIGLEKDEEKKAQKDTDEHPRDVVPLAKQALLV